MIDYTVPPLSDLPVWELENWEDSKWTAWKRRLPKAVIAMSYMKGAPDLAFSKETQTKMQRGKKLGKDNTKLN